MIKAVLTDIEGTTSPIAFVHQTLFPYARQRIRNYLREHAAEPAVQGLMNDVEALEHQDLSLDEAADLLEQWVDEDRKATPLKTLQGMIWKTGYENGTLKGEVYAEVPQYLRAWHEKGITLAVYSSGSVQAQKLIFGHTEYGDLRPLFSAYFDTRLGAKRQAAAYRKIAAQLRLDAQQILFLSDVGAELDAAAEVGMPTCQLIRDDSIQAADQHPAARDFAEVDGLIRRG